MKKINKQAQRRQTLEASLMKTPGDLIAEDSRIIHNAIADEDLTLFAKLKNEIHWQNMYHAQGQVPRLVCCQGSFGPDGSMPVYRHPSDQSLPLLHFSPIVTDIKSQVEKIVGHSMNHVLIQLYRNGEDYISEHSDKTLDIVRGSFIVNASVGAQRTMRLRTKKSAQTRTIEGIPQPRTTQLVPMPHASVFVLGPRSNERWLHGINHDKRPLAEKSEVEVAFSGERISLTFRNIGTFLSGDCQKIWGQGACSKESTEPHAVINGVPDAAQRLIDAFGHENQQSTFDWDAAYGSGFDVLHFQHAPVETALLFLSGDDVCDLRVRICLEELQKPYLIASAPAVNVGQEYRPQICLRDTDKQRTQVLGDLPILLYLAQKYCFHKTFEPAFIEAYSHISMIEEPISTSTARTLLQTLEKTLQGRDYIAIEFSMTDCAYWPTLEKISRSWEFWDPKQYPLTAAYYERLHTRHSVKAAMNTPEK